jgi:hypothetical protein
MGFSWLPPRQDLAFALQVADAFAPHADWALIAVSPPWTRLLEGADPTSLVRANELGLASLYRGKGLRIVVSIDPTDGLDRSRDAPELRAALRSISDTTVQTLFRAYVLAMARELAPDYLGIASETNLVRELAPAALYEGLRRAANDAAVDVLAVLPATRLFISVNVEVAWGRPGNTFAGVDLDRAEFPFVQALALSSYPYLGGFATPDELPADYYARLTAHAPLPMIYLEGGWPSTSVAGVISDPATQSRYLEVQARLLDTAAAIGWFQITFTDLDVAAWGPGVEPFAHLGLVTTTLAPKPALATWDAILRRPRQ